MAHDPTHVLTEARDCPVTGRPCPVALSLLRRASAAMLQAQRLVGDDLALGGTVETAACGPCCRFDWAASADGVTITALAPSTPAEAGPPAPYLRAEALRVRLA